MLRSPVKDFGRTRKGAVLHLWTRTGCLSGPSLLCPPVCAAVAAGRAATMKQLQRKIERDRSGYVTLLPEEAEDMWHVYNLIAVGDQVRASTIRYGGTG